MNNAIFFEGPVRTGKSTLLRAFFAPRLPAMGGFVVERLLDGEGVAAAYRMVDLADLTDAFPLPQAESRFLAVEQPWDGNPEGVFLTVSPRRVFPEVLRATGLEALRRASARELVFLDEIGGVELLDPAFRTALFGLLQGPAPCVGIIKQKSGARDAASWQEELRKLVRVLPMPRDARELADSIQVLFQDR